MKHTIEIVLVDDEQLQLDYMQKLIEQTAESLEIKIEISQYLSGEAFLFALEDHPTWNLAFLDIEMEELNGMQVAKILRKKSPQLELVFATAYAEYAIEGYEVQALDYLLKPINQQKITRVLKRYLEEQPEDTAYLIAEVEGQTTRLNLEDILYVEANMGEVLVVLVDQKLPLKMTLLEFQDLLDERFVATHRSYLVNLQYISRLLKKDVALSNGEKIPLSRRRAKEVQSDFIDYYKGSVFYGE
ncbi:LytTR family DNA-binding domain-containing protein [Carnobacteriaceae bacterium 52-44]